MSKVSVPIDKGSSIIAVRLKVIAGELTTLNGLNVNDTYIATLNAGDGVATFADGAAKPPAYNEPDLKDIPAKGIPSGNYEIRTTEDNITGTHTWDAQTEVSDIAVVNEDIADIIANLISKMSSPAEDNLVTALSGGGVQDSGKAFRTSAQTAWANSDEQIPTDKFLKNILASTSAGKGAALIGAADAGDYFTGTTVEAILQEIGALLTNLAVDLSTKTCSLMIVYYTVTNRCVLATPPVQDSSGMIAQGTYRLQYVFKNAVVADPENDINWGTETSELSSPNNRFELQAPDNGDALYSGGTAGYCYLYARIRFENLSPVDNETAWSYNSKQISEPEGLPEGLVRVLGENGSNAQKVNDMVKAFYAKSPTAASLIAAAVNKHLSGSGAPTGDPTSLDQVYHDTATGDIYMVSSDGSDLSWVKTYDKP